MDILTPAGAKPPRVLYYGVMFRTRDLLIVMTSLILTFLVVVIALMLSPEEDTGVRTQPREVILGEPKESYEVVPYEDKNSLRDERDAFIEKVKRSYVPPPLNDTEPIPQPEDVVVVEPDTPPPITVPTPPVPLPPTPISVEIPRPTDTATVTPYGNTGF